MLKKLPETNYPHIEETPMEETSVEESGEINTVPDQETLPSIEKLDALLHESEGIASVAAMSEEEIDRMIEQRQESLDRLQNLGVIRESRLQRVENFNPLKELRPDDYKRLVQEEIIDAPYAKRLEKLDSVIRKLESLDSPSADTSAELEKLSDVRNTIREKLESQITELQDEVAARRDTVKNMVLEHYKMRAEELEKIVATIESNPRVLEQLQTMAEKEMGMFFAEREKKRREAEEKIEENRKVVIREATRYIQSLSSRQSNALKRIGELLGNENIEEELIRALYYENADEQSHYFKEVRNRLMNAIIDGEGEKQLKDPAEVVPWKTKTTSIPYYLALNTLKETYTEETLSAAAKAGDNNAQQLLEQLEQVVMADKALFKLFDKEWIVDRKSNKKLMGTFWAAFETRKINDKEGITVIRKKEREIAAKQEADFAKATKEIVERGGFVVEVPVVKKVRGNNEVVGRAKGVVRLVKGVSKKGNEYWRVAEVFGATNELKVGDTSPFDMRSFPYWLREAYERTL